LVRTTLSTNDGEVSLRAIGESFEALVRDQDSVNFCDAHNMAMVFTGIRHFKH
jgi:hypothetical protein